MTNSPIVEKQLALDEYRKEIGGTIMLPQQQSSGEPLYARIFLHQRNPIPKDEDPDVTIASVFSVIRNASVPCGTTTPDQPNISSTRWRTVSDQKRPRLFF